MKKTTFDKWLVEHFDGCVKRSRRYGERADDVLQEAFVEMYEREYYKTLPEDLSKGRVFGALGKFTDRVHLDVLRRERTRGEVSYEEEGIEGSENPTVALQRDVRKALGTLSAYHYALVVANLIEEVPLRELALRTGETFYRVFTELEIAKACLKTELDAYRYR